MKLIALIIITLVFLTAAFWGVHILWACFKGYNSTYAIFCGLWGFAFLLGFDGLAAMWKDYKEIR